MSLGCWPDSHMRAHSGVSVCEGEGPLRLTASAGSPRSAPPQPAAGGTQAAASPSPAVWNAVRARTCLPVTPCCFFQRALAEFIQLLLQKDDILIIMAHDSGKNLWNFSYVNSYKYAGFSLFPLPCSYSTSVRPTVLWCGSGSP